MFAMWRHLEFSCYKIMLDYVINCYINAKKCAVKLMLGELAMEARPILFFVVIHDLNKNVI